jgi:lipid-A-disaccharide synthase-like uncharacterized protein
VGNAEIVSQGSRILGFAGTVIAAIGFLPQIRHLAREHCSAGVNVAAWQIWLLSSVLILFHALVVFDVVFVTLQTVNIAAVTLIIFLAKRYEGMSCPFHRLAAGAG